MAARALAVPPCGDATAKDRRAAARAAIEKGLFMGGGVSGAPSSAITEQVLYDSIKDLPYDWRGYDPEETVRFYALRLTDSKLISKAPQEIINTAPDLPTSASCARRSKRR